MKTRYLRLIKKQRGFTLIELLAVILILGIIALIAIPTVSRVVKQSRRGSFENSVNNLATSVSNLCYSSLLEDKDISGTYYIEDGKTALKLDIKGDIPDMGIIQLDKDCKVSLYVTDYDNYAVYEDDKLVVTDASSFNFYKNIEELKKDDLKVGDKVITFSYNNTELGGGSVYIVTDSGTDDNKLYIGLDNGLIAKYEYKDYANIRAFGANGTLEDLDIINYLVENNITSIYIPEGDYDLNNLDITFPSYIRLKGKKDKTIFRNVNFTANYGISLDSITMIGGTTKKIKFNNYFDVSGNIMINSSPIGIQKLYYNNCSFYNADYVSVAIATTGENYFDEEEISNSHFENIKFVGVYHVLNNGNGYYHDNTFKNLGDTEALTGFRNAFMLGDISNNYNVRYKEVKIENNTFDTLNTKNDYERGVHVINANFIAVHGYTITINNNKFYNLNGYGEDRESIYTKGEMVYVTNNYIKNGGLGEAYICLKQSKWKGIPHSVVSGNTIEGEYGSAIRTYQGTEISNNKITLTHGNSAITSNNKNEEENFTVVIKDNDINVTTGYYYINGVKDDGEDASLKGALYFHHAVTNLVVENNKVVFNKAEEISSELSAINITYNSNNVTIRNNDITSYSVGAGVYNSYNNVTIILDSNKIVSDGRAIQVKSVPKDLTETNKVVKVINNDTTCNTTLDYHIDVRGHKTSNFDTLYFTPGKYNTSYTSNYLHISGGYLSSEYTNLVVGSYTKK